ncbi:MFS transporter [Zavarzinia compransoris]|uniref:MFS transporter n=1 Tax=Zavarzinia marina TaxID=2911065 RepID=UPI001F2BF469|nr:MFS transporter [Zavarzinia marina]MCF4165729.1 MFS transporter [Zavarzinia marina]
MSDGATARWADVLRERHFPVFLLLCFGIWLHAADSLLVATAMPTVVAEIGGAAYLAWATALYVLASIVAGAAAGSAMRRFTIRAAITGGALLYGVGCVASAAAPDMAVMLLGRALQGAGGGAMVALAYVALERLFPAALWPRLFAVVAVIWGVAALFGPLIGGLFTEAGFWRGAFWAFAAQALVLGLAFARFLPGDGTAKARAGEAPTPMPLARLFVVALGVLGIAAAGVIGHVPSALGAGLAGLALLGFAIGLDRRAAVPILPRATFRPGAAAAGFMLVLAVSIATMPFTVFAPILMEHLHGTRPLVVGYVIAVEAVAWTLTAVVFAGVGPRAERRVILAGAAAAGLAVPLSAWAVPFGGLFWVAVVAFLQGGGMGMVWAFVTRRIVEAVDEGERGLAAAVVPTVQLLGYALGAAGAGIVANARGLGADPGPATALAAGPWIFVACVPLALVGMAAARRLAR